MSLCERECNHGHGDGGGHEDDITPATHNLLYEKIDFDSVTTLNESEPNAGRDILKKSWSERLKDIPELKSSADEQLLIHIPFTGQIRLHSIIVRSSCNDDAPRSMKLYTNRENLDFASAAELKPAQTIELAQTSDLQEVNVKRALFNATHSIDILIEDNFSEGRINITRLSYLAFKGDFTRLIHKPVNFIYEAAANPADHKPVVETAHSLDSFIG